MFISETLKYYLVSRVCMMKSKKIWTARQEIIINYIPSANVIEVVNEHNDDFNFTPQEFKRFCEEGLEYLKSLQPQLIEEKIKNTKALITYYNGHVEALNKTLQELKERNEQEEGSDEI